MSACGPWQGGPCLGRPAYRLDSVRLTLRIGWSIHFSAASHPVAAADAPALAGGGPAPRGPGQQVDERPRCQLHRDAPELFVVAGNIGKRLVRRADYRRAGTGTSFSAAAGGTGPAGQHAALHPSDLAAGMCGLYGRVAPARGRARLRKAACWPRAGRARGGGRAGDALAGAGKSYMEWRWPPCMGAEAEPAGVVAGARGASKPHGPDYEANRSTTSSLSPASRDRVAGEDGGSILGGALGDDLEARRARLRARIKARMHRPEHRLIWFDVDGLRSMQRRPGTRKAIAGEKGA